jgi:hypothetical protein
LMPTLTLPDLERHLWGAPWNALRVGCSP